MLVFSLTLYCMNTFAKTDIFRRVAIGKTVRERVISATCVATFCRRPVFSAPYIGSLIFCIVGSKRGTPRLDRHTFASSRTAELASGGECGRSIRRKPVKTLRGQCPMKLRVEPRG